MFEVSATSPFSEFLGLFSNIVDVVDCVDLAMTTLLRHFPSVSGEQTTDKHEVSFEDETVT